MDDEKAAPEESKKNEASSSSAKEDEEDEPDVYGITSLVPLNRHFLSLKCFQQIRSLLLSYIPKDHLIHRRLVEADTCPLALVINERFINLPSKIALPCYEKLVNEINELDVDKRKVKKVKTADPEASGSSSADYHFEHVLMICKMLKLKKNEDEATSQPRLDAPKVIHIHDEDEVFADAAEASFDYSVAGQCDSDIYDWDDEDNLYEPFRRVLVMSKAKWEATIDSLKQFV